MSREWQWCAQVAFQNILAAGRGGADWKVAMEEAGRLDIAVTQSKVTGGEGWTPRGVEDRPLPAWKRG